jgi:thiamine monophosphate kinase
MLDTSDGLAESARLLAGASRVRVEIDLEAIPPHSGLRTIPAGPEREAALLFGGDYELLAAVPEERVRAAVQAVRAVGGAVHPIGMVLRGRGAFLRRSGVLAPMPAGGWEPFRWALSHAGASQRSG